MTASVPMSFTAPALAFVNDFELALDMIEDGCTGLVEVLTRKPRGI